ncbi:hypothetical protein IAU60_001244 [Kwoniella sp. DSM 27419]
MATAQHPSTHPQPLPLKHLLRDYTNPHPLRSPSPLPASSRVDPRLTQRKAPPTSASPLLWNLSTWWLFLRVLFTKGLHILWNLLCHAVVGPKRKSWGYRMTLITSFMRNIADHSTLADIALIRRFISLHSLMPLPGDAVVTPITFTVPLRKGQDVARGFLRQWDLQETGTRELSGEWVVGTDVWKRLKAERRARNRKRQGARRVQAVEGGQAASGSRSSSFSDEHRPSGGLLDFGTDSDSSKRSTSAGERVIYYVHGGAYYVGNAATHRLITIGVSKACNARVFAITYRLAPEHAFPLPLHDVLQGYLRLIAPPLSIPPENIIVAGDSAGGGLSLALCMYLRDEGYKLPAGLVLMSPWVDLTMSCGSWDENADSDVVPRPEADDHLNPVGCYLGPDGISRYLTHPYASPLFGNLNGLPPMLIQSGDSEVLRDEITLLAHKATLSGVHVTHELYEDMVHVFQMFSFLPATAAAINNVGRWVRSTLPQIEEEERNSGGMDGKKQVGKLGKEVEEEMASEARVVSGDGQQVPDETGVAGPDELEAGFDYFSHQRSRVRTPKVSALRLRADSVTSQDDAAPSVDLDSLPAGSSSGTPTPTESRSRSPALSLDGVPHARQPTSPQPQPQYQSQPQSEDEDPMSYRHTLPRLRRSQTAQATSTIRSSPPTQPNFRRRRPTTSSLHVSPAQSAYAPSNPVSPTPSIRMRLRGSTFSQPQPSARARSKSHSNILQLVEGYVEGGAANETTVIAPGGEVRSVGVLGEDEDGF